ncbi:MAG: Crp/Fnr family transcriptional regulator [Clostridia bacterium]|nr:Crp/Fnr family transcriptional regulator [Clostridia bacterium]
MKKYLEVLKKCILFKDIENDNLLAILGCIGATVKFYKKKEIIIREGESTNKIGIVLPGSVQIERNDFLGNRSILSTVNASELFLESFACAEVKKVPIDIIANEDTEIMLVEYRRIMNPCCNACNFHSKLIMNIVKDIAVKNILFHQKIEVTSKRTTREKLMTYLLLQSKKHNSNTFKIPYNRGELADYLGVDRSGLSNEISKMQKEGILRSNKYSFTIL